MLNITTCPTCGSRRIKKVKRDWTGAFKGQSYHVRKLAYYDCLDCGEKVYDREAMRRIQAASPAFSTRARNRQKPSPQNRAAA